MTAHETSKRVTVAEIARAAGVSVPTVSRVLNGRADVAPETRERVEDLLRQHGYRRRGTSRGGSARLVDLVFNDLDSPWAVEIIRGAESVAHAAGIGVVISAVHRHEPAARQWLDNVRARSSDGVVLVTSELDPSIQAELDRLRVPTVIVDASGGSPLNAPTIGATNCGSPAAMLRIPMSRPRSLEAGSTCVISAKSTAWYIPKPSPSTIAATTVAGRLWPTMMIPNASATTSPEPITKGLRRPTRSESRPPRAAVTIVMAA